MLSSTNRHSLEKGVVHILKFIRTLKTDLHRAFLSPSFLLGAVVVCGVFLFASIEIVFGYSCPAYTFETVYSGNMVAMILLGAPLAYSASFAAEVSNGYFRPAIIRSDTGTYTLSKCVVTALSGGTAAVLGTLAFIVILLFLEPYTLMEDCRLATDNYSDTVKDYLEFLYGYFSELILFGGENFGGFLYFAARLYVIFLMSMFFSVLGLCVSAYLPNKYAACASPFLLGFVINRGTLTLGIPSILDPIRVGLGYISGMSAVSVLLYSTLFFVVLTVLCSFIFIRAAKRRLANA